MKKYFNHIAIKQSFLVIAFTAICMQHLPAQIKWPAITQTAKPWTRWWWQGSAVNKSDLSILMKKYQQAGLGGLEITPIYGVKGTEKQFIPFLSGQWVEMLLHTLQEGKKLGLGIDMATGTGWPFGGPWVTETDACKYLAYKKYELNGGGNLQDRIEFLPEAFVRTANGKPLKIEEIIYPVAANKNLQSLALDQVRYPGKLPLVALMAYDENGKAVDVLDKVENGMLKWNAPGGKWILFALFQGLHGKMVERAAPGGEGNVTDHFSANALHNYLRQFDKAFAGKDISYLRSFFNDSYEVDDARGQSNWTPGFFTAFKQRRGYDLKNELPALFTKDSSEKHTRILYDYRQTIGELLLEKFTQSWHTWAKQKGKLIRNQSHGSPANILDLYAAIDIPETEGTDILRFKFATSAANVNGKKLAAAEAATWLDEHFKSSLADVKIAADKYFVGGVNHIFYHGTNYSPPGEAWPGWLFYAAVHFHPNNPFWKDFEKLNSYVARVQSFLQSGKPSNDLLLYFPYSDRNNEPGKDMLHHFDGMEGFELSNFKNAGEQLLKDGYAFDFISDIQIRKLKNTGGKLQSGNAIYQTILLADVKAIPLETWQQLIQLAGNGATIIVYKNLPADVPGWNALEERENKFNTLKAGLQFKGKANEVQIASTGKGFFLMGDDLNELLLAAKIKRELLVDKSLQFVRREDNNGPLYFISNPTDKVINEWVPINVNAAGMALYNPMTEKSGLAKFKKIPASKSAEVLLQLQPFESVIIQTFKSARTGNFYPYEEVTGKPQKIEGEWKLSFISGGPVLPASTNVAAPVYWTTLRGDGVKIFSGTAQYSIHFKKPVHKNGVNAWVLDLGQVKESAEIFLNGKKLATVIGPSYRVTVAANLFLPGNLLQIKVSNGMANRIADLDKRGIVWKKFYNINFPARLAENRGADGLFTAINLQPQPSGLAGPVTLTPVVFIK